VWSDEQVAALRTRITDATAKAVDKAAGAVLGVVNTIAARIRSRN
jgi:hypothetical protein